MKVYPSISDYHISVENKYYLDRKNLYSPIYRNSTDLYFEPGGRAVVYKVKDSFGAFKAIKFFTSNRDPVFDKYSKISSFLNDLNSSYFVNFEFNHEMILCKGINSEIENNYFPGLVMDWAEGTTLGNFVKNATEKGLHGDLLKLTESFKKLSIFIIESCFGHGDLKHDNIIVDSDCNLKLIDYDDLFIPEFKGFNSTELGTPSFQHPKRKYTDFNEKVDDFSILSIFVSLVTLTKYPQLFNKYNDQQNLFFRSEDFENPDNSELFDFLEHDLELAKWAYLLKKSLSNDNIYIAGLKNFLNGVFPRPNINIIKTPQKVINGREITLKWETDFVDELFLNNQEIELIGQINLVVNSNTRVLFFLKNHFEKAEYEYDLDILPEPKIKEFIINEQRIEFGKSTQISWEVENVQQVELHWDGKTENLLKKGIKTINPIQNTSYKLVLFALDGLLTEEREVSVQVYKKVEIKWFTSDLDFVIETLPVRLTWDVNNATKIILASNSGSEIDISKKKEIEVFPLKTTVFYLIAMNEMFTIESSKLKIEVQSIPTFSTSIIPRLSVEKELIPKIELDFKGKIENILSIPQIKFQKTMKSTKRFNLLNILRDIIN